MQNDFWTIDPITLREVITDRADYDEALRTASELDRIFLLRIDNRLEDAWAVANELMQRSEPNFRLTILLADLARWSGDFDTASELLDVAEELAPTERATAIVAQHTGQLFFDLDDYETATDCFEEAVDIRMETGASQDLIDSSQLALDRCLELLAIEASQSQKGKRWRKQTGTR